MTSRVTSSDGLNSVMVNSDRSLTNELQVLQTCDQIYIIRTCFMRLEGPIRITVIYFVFVSQIQCINLVRYSSGMLLSIEVMKLK